MTANSVSFIMLLQHVFLWTAFLRRLEIKLFLPPWEEFKKPKKPKHPQIKGRIGYWVLSIATDYYLNVKIRNFVSSSLSYTGESICIYILQGWELSARQQSCLGQTGVEGFKPSSGICLVPYANQLLYTFHKQLSQKDLEQVSLTQLLYPGSYRIMLFFSFSSWLRKGWRELFPSQNNVQPICEDTFWGN